MQLYPFQRVGVKFLNIADSALVADEMGLGKSVQAIRTLEERNSYPALIVCPNSVKTQWERMFHAWAPGRKVLVAKSGKSGGIGAATEIVNGTADVLIVNWESLRALSRPAAFGSIRIEGCSNCDSGSKRKPSLCQREDKILNSVQWGTVVADEVHKAKDPHSLRTRCLWSVGDKADRRIGLTGTPIANDAGELWSVMRFVSPNEFPTKSTWINRYAMLEANIWSGNMDIVGLRPDRRAELDMYFLPRFIRRLKKDVLKDLPPKVYERRDVELSGKQRRAYDQMEKEMMAGLEGGIITATNKLAASLRLRQLASAYGEVVRDDSTLFKTIDQQVYLSEPSSKLDELETVLEELGGRQAVVFAESSQLIRLAAARLGTNCIIDGSTSNDQRELNLKSFMERDERVILLTVGAGGEGLDGLQVADTAIYLQRPWSSVLNRQSEDRLHRIGQNATSVTYIDIVAMNTIEEKVFETLAKKNSRLQDIVRDG